MTTFTVFGQREQLARNGSSGLLRDRFRALLRRHREHRAIAALARRTPHVIRDMGFEPDRIYEALDGTWDEIGPASARRHLPRASRV